MDAGAFLDIETRPAGGKVLDEDAVGYFAEDVEEALSVCIAKNVAGNFDANLALPLVFVEMAQVGNELVEIHLGLGEFPVLRVGHAVDGNVDAVDAGIEDRTDPVRRQQDAIGGGVDVLDAAAGLGVAHHVGKAGVEQRFALLIQAQHLERLVEFIQVVDDLLIDLEIETSLPASGGFDQFAVAGRTEGALEIAGVDRIDEKDKGSGERDDRLQRGAVLEIDAGLDLGGHEAESDTEHISIFGDFSG